MRNRREQVIPLPDPMFVLPARGGNSAYVMETLGNISSPEDFIFDYLFIYIRFFILLLKLFVVNSIPS